MFFGGFFTFLVINLILCYVNFEKWKTCGIFTKCMNLMTFKKYIYFFKNFKIPSCLNELPGSPGSHNWGQNYHKLCHTKVSFFVQCIKKQLITLQNFNIQTCFSQFLWFFSIQCWFKGHVISRIDILSGAK